MTTYSEGPGRDPYLAASFSFANRLMRVLWSAVWLLLFRPSPRPLHAWRALLLRLFGARIGANCHIYPGARIWAPWNLECGAVVAIADGATIYNPSKILLGSRSTISQEAYVCTATHDYNDPAFPLVSLPIEVGEYAWVCARAIVLPGVTVGDGAVLGAAAVAAHDLSPWTVYAGVPARKVSTRSYDRAG